MSSVKQARGSGPKGGRDARRADEFPGHWGRRILALCIDWALSCVISAGFFGFDSMATLGVFAVMTVILVGTAGFTIGHRICGLGIRTLDGGLPGPLRALGRTLGVCLVLPPVILDPAGRGLNDRWSGTQIVQLGRARVKR